MRTSGMGEPLGRKGLGTKGEKKKPKGGKK